MFSEIIITWPKLGISANKLEHYMMGRRNYQHKKLKVNNISEINTWFNPSPHIWFSREEVPQQNTPKSTHIVKNKINMKIVNLHLHVIVANSHLWASKIKMMQCKRQWRWRGFGKGMVFEKRFGEGKTRVYYMNSCYDT